MKERIVCAAIWLKNIHPRAFHRPSNTPGGVVLCGYRHPNIISQVNALTGKSMDEIGEYEDGFLTNKNRFLNRCDAAKLFISNGGKPQFNKDKLFSEDLY